jgi:hypothetical protein
MPLRHNIQTINTNNMETVMIGRAICCAKRATSSEQGTPALHYVPLIVSRNNVIAHAGNARNAPVRHSTGRRRTKAVATHGAVRN